MNNEAINSDSEKYRNFHNTGADASHLIQKSNKAKGYSPVAIIEVKSHEASKIPLGFYSEAEPPKGFAIEIHPDPDPEESLTTTIVSLLKEKSKQYELVLLLDNYGIKTVTVEVFELKHGRKDTQK